MLILGKYEVAVWRGGTWRDGRSHSSVGSFCFALLSFFLLFYFFFMLFLKILCSGRSEKTTVFTRSPSVITFITQVKYRRADLVQQGFGVMQPLHDINRMYEFYSALSSHISYNICIQFWLPVLFDMVRVNKTVTREKTAKDRDRCLESDGYCRGSLKSAVFIFRSCVWSKSE